MTSLSSDDKNEVTSGITSYKHPVFDGEKPSEFKDWWDNAYATLEMNDLEEYVNIDYKDVGMPTKESTVLGEYQDKTDLKALAACDKNKLSRKEMKKAKAHMVKVTKGYAKRLVMDAKTPYEAFTALKEKYSVAKVRQDFTKLDKEWNEFKLTDETVDPDKVFATLDEHSKKLKEFGDRYEKDALQILSKVEVAMPENYEHVFTLLNTEAEHKKTSVVQLETAKRMIKAHYDTNIAKEAIKEGGTMMCMYVSDGERNNQTRSNGMKCVHCRKGGHTAYKDGKPFCFALIAALKGNSNPNTNKSNNNGVRFKGKCHNCKKPGHKSFECTSPKKEETTEDVNALLIATIVFDETEINHVSSYTYTEMLGDTGAQGHIFPPSSEMKKKKTTDVVKMANGSKSGIYQRDNCTIEDEIGNEVLLKNRRVVGDIVSPIISLTQLHDEGWDMKSGRNKNQRFIYMDKNGSRLTFVERKKNLFYLSARVTESVLIANYTVEPSKIPVPMVSDDEDTDDDMPALESRDADDDSSDSEEEEEPTLPPIARKKTRFSNDVVIDVDAKKKPSEKVIKNYRDALLSEPKLPTMSYSDAHHKWGHHGEERLRKMAKLKGLRLIGKMEPCNACGIVKVKAKPISTVSDINKKATDVGERLFVDITGPFPLTATKWHKATRNKLFWYGVSDQFSGKMVSSFNYNKSELVDMIDETFKYFQGRSKKVKYLRMDNAGENQAVAKLCKEKDCQVEFTPPDTPKLNNMVERGFAVRWEIAKVLMQNASLKNKVKMNKKIVIEAIKTASFLNDECPQKGKEISVNELFFGSKGKDRVKAKDFVEWGRIGFVANKRTKTKKANNRGTAMLMVGYALEHPSGTYRLYDPNNDSIVTSNSVTWTDFKPWQAASVDTAIGELKDNAVEPTVEIKQEDIEIEENENTELPTTKRSILAPVLPATEPDRPAQRITRRMAAADAEIQKAVHTEYDEATKQTYKVTGDIEAIPITLPNSTENEAGGISETGGTNEDVQISVVWTEDFVQATKNIDGMDELLDLFLMHSCIQSDPGEPTSWKEALDGPEREWWIKSITAEFNNFISRGAWEFVPLQEAIDSGRKPVPTKLVFKKKDEIDGSTRFKSRNVTLGFMMVPGVDFTERFSPVATDAALKTQVALNLKQYKKGWRTQNCDIEAAFLEPSMDNPMYIEPHPALVSCGFLTEQQRKELAILLKNSMYGNVDAAIKFFKLLAKWIRENMKMKQSQSDPCVFYKLDDDGELLLMVSVTVDDCAVTGMESDINWFMDELEKRFKITRGGILRKHLGVDYEWGLQDDGRAFCKATMDKKVNATIAQYEKHIGGKVKVYDSPGKPHEYLEKHEGDPIDIEMYRSFVGQVMFFTTKLGPKLGNATRALSGFMGNPGEVHWSALGRLIGYMKGMQLKGILYKLQGDTKKRGLYTDHDRRMSSGLANGKAHYIIG